MRINRVFSDGAKGVLATVSVLALVGGASVGVAAADPRVPGSGTAVESVAAPIAADPFEAPACEFTSWVPSELQLTITGSRLASYNDGNVVPMYGNNPDTSYHEMAPICGVRQVAGEPVAEWMYCTDATLNTCARLDTDGNPVREGANSEDILVGPTVPTLTNPRLSDDQVAIVGFLLQHGIDWPTNHYPSGESTRTDNTTRSNRQALQFAIWCISDEHDVFGDPRDRAKCTELLDADRQQRILDSIPDTAETLELTRTDPASGRLEVGQTASFALRTDFIDQPLTVTVPAGATVEVCEGEATLVGDTLTVAGTAGDTATVVLCVTSDQPGDVAITVGGTPEGDKLINWNQADPECQVFATFDEHKQLTSSGSVTFGSDDEGDSDGGDTGSLGSGSLGTGGTGSLALGSLALGSVGLGLGSLGASGSLGENGSLGDSGSVGAHGSTGSGKPDDDAGSIDPMPRPEPEQSPAPTPTIPAAPLIPSEPSPDRGQVDVGNLAPKGERPHAIDGGGAELSSAVRTGAGLAIALLVIGGIGAVVTLRRLHR